MYALPSKIDVAGEKKGGGGEGHTDFCLKNAHTLCAMQGEPTMLQCAKEAAHQALLVSSARPVNQLAAFEPYCTQLQWLNFTTSVAVLNVC